MLEPEFPAAARKIDNQWPLEVIIAIAANHAQRPSHDAELIQDSLCANIAQMPDFIRAGGEIDNALWQFVMGVGQHENAQRL